MYKYFVTLYQVVKITNRNKLKFKKLANHYPHDDGKYRVFNGKWLLLNEYGRELIGRFSDLFYDEPLASYSDQFLGSKKIDTLGSFTQEDLDDAIKNTKREIPAYDRKIFLDIDKYPTEHVISTDRQLDILKSYSCNENISNAFWSDKFGKDDLFIHSAMENLFITICYKDA